MEQPENHETAANEEPDTEPEMQRETEAVQNDAH